MKLEATKIKMRMMGQRILLKTIQDVRFSHFTKLPCKCALNSKLVFLSECFFTIKRLRKTVTYFIQ